MSSLLQFVAEMRHLCSCVLLRLAKLGNIYLFSVMFPGWLNCVSPRVTYVAAAKFYVRKAKTVFELI